MHALCPGEGGEGACQTDGVDAMVRIKPGVFHRQQRALHQIGNLVNTLHHPSLGTKATDLHTIGREHPQWLLGLVMRQR